MHLGILVGLSLLLTLPVLIHGAPDLSHDGLDHARWAKHFAQQFWRGDLYPRWFTDVNEGFGGPSGFFYPPLTSYVSSLFWPLVAAHDPYGWLSAGYSLVLALVLSGITAYLWLRSIAKPGAALLGAVVYVLAPYHVAIDLYQRGASAEFWIFVWLPLVMLAAQRLIEDSRWAIPGAAVAYALAVLSHPTVSLGFAPVPLAYVFVFCEKPRRIKTALLLLAAMLLGVGVNALYLMPAMFDQHKVYAEWQTSGHGDYRNEWLIQDPQQLTLMARYAYGLIVRNGTQIPWELVMQVRVLAVTLITLLALAVLFVISRRWERERRARSMAVFWTVVAAISLVMMTQLSSPVWRLAGFLKYLQFPFRFNIVLVVSVAALAALAAQHLLEAPARMLSCLLAATTVLWLGVDLFSATQVYSIWRQTNMDKITTNHALLRTQIDYPTMWPKPGNLTALGNMSAFDVLVATHPPKTADLQGLGSAHIESWEPRRVVIQIQAAENGRLTVNHFYYEGWTARVAGVQSNLAVRPSFDGLMQLAVPKGSYTLTLELPRDTAEEWGLRISLLSIVALGGLAGRAWFYGTYAKHIRAATA
ncbi:MAG TPA: hypothetical protein VKB58_18480 [Terriglobales bacterium]|jgi:hypothetical protein|nr:hypothetical protein [Terriglobales bacterium]